MKRFLLVLISFILVLSLTGCSVTPQENQSDINNEKTETSANSISLAYCFNDVINPYKSLTEVNQKLSTLIYDSLITLDSNYNIIHLLANNIITHNSTCTISLKDVSFTDGTPLTASDVIYSFEAAKESGNYKELISSVISISADNQKTVVFSLKKDDPFFAALLTFPIIKNGTADLTTNNNLPIPPVGCGRFIPDFNNSKLIRNENYHSLKPQISEIKLLNVPDYEALSYAVTTGKISVWLDTYKGGQTLTASGGTLPVTSNYFIYIGINADNETLKIPQMRHALTTILDRSIICDEVYDGYAVPSSGVYNPSWQAVLNLQENIIKPNNNIFLANLEEIGYNKLDTFGYRVTNEGKSFHFNLIYCNDTEAKINLANEIASQFCKAGIKVTAVGKNYEEYISALKTKDFDLYLAETLINNNMDISPLVLSNGNLNYGGVFNLDSSEENESEKNAYTSFDEIISEYYSGSAELHDIINMFNLITPIIPICYKSNAISYQIGVNCPQKFSPCDPYYMISDCTIN